MSWEENTAVQDEQANWAEFRAGRCVLEVICDNPGRVRTNTVIWEDSAVSAETSASVLQFCDVLRCGVSLVEPAASDSIKAISTAFSASFSVLCTISRC